MSKKTWIIGGAVVVALIGATVIGRSLTGDKKAKSDSGKVTTLKVAHTLKTMFLMILLIRMVILMAMR